MREVVQKRNRKAHERHRDHGSVDVVGEIERTGKAKQRRNSPQQLRDADVVHAIRLLVHRVRRDGERLISLEEQVKKDGNQKREIARDSARIDSRDDGSKGHGQVLEAEIGRLRVAILDVRDLKDPHAVHGNG